MNGIELLQAFSTQPLKHDFSIRDLSLNSQTLQEGDVFFACPGSSQDGRLFISAALEKKPAAIVCESYQLDQFSIPRTQVPIIPVKNLREKLSAIAGRFYGHPSKQLKVTGVTGTSGKTTTTYLLYQAWNLLGYKAGCIGTLGIIAPGFQEQTGLTTPDAISLQRSLRQLISIGVTHVSMEVSSHALTQFRTQAITFENAVFTNLTPEHLDYHKTMASYAKAKQILFRQPGLQHAVINGQDPYGMNMLSQLHPDVEACLYSTQDKITGSFFRSFRPVVTQHVECTAKGIEADIQTPWGSGRLSSKLVGQFNLSNLLAVVTVLCQQGFAFQEVLALMPKLNPPMGRMQVLGGARTPHIIVDYAHKPDALRQALLAARQGCKRKLWCVFGCGGNRDISKRELMGAVAAELADAIVLTNDNPREEPPQKIIDDILKGIDDKSRSKVYVEPCRKTAIAHALSHALSFDVILVAGKGHESYQILGQERLDYSDIDYIKQLLSENTL